MQQMNFNGYFSIKKVSPPYPLQKTSRKGHTLYKIEAVGTTVAERVYDEQATQYVNVSRECDITFTDLTENHARIITDGCDLSLFGATVFSYMVPLGFNYSTAADIARLADPNIENKVIMAQAVIEGLIASIGEQHRSNLNKIIPKERRKTVILVRPGQWALRASTSDIKEAQTAEVLIDGNEF